MSQGESSLLQDTNAMTEVALALAMAFFTVLVLALVSMGVPHMSLKLPGTNTIAVSASGGSRDVDADEVLVIYFESNFYNDQLKKLSNLPASNKLIVAIPGTVSLQGLMELQTQFADRQVAITALDPAWQARLESFGRTGLE